MTLEKGHIYFGAACLVAGIVLGAGFRSCGNPAKPVPADPVVIHDTVTRDSIQIKEVVKWKSRDYQDSIIPHKPLVTADSDTIAIPDDTIRIPIDHYEYRDTFTADSSRIELGIQFSGYKAKIDGIDLTSQYTVQPRTIVKKKGWGQFVGIGIGVGYGASFVGHPSGVGTVVYAAPEVGVHITYGWGYHW